MKRPIVVAVILALGMTIPGPGCYEALAQDRGVQANTVFQASDGAATRETVVKPVFLQLKTDAAGQKIDFKGIWLKLSPVPLWERIKVRGERRIVAPTRSFSATLPSPRSIAQKEIAGEIGSIDAVSTDESRGTEKVSAALGGRKFQTGRFWRAVSHLGAQIDPSRFFDGAMASLATFGDGQFLALAPVSISASDSVAAPQIRLSPVLLRGDAQEQEDILPLGGTPQDSGNRNLQSPESGDRFLQELKWNMKYVLGKLYDEARLDIPTVRGTYKALKRTIILEERHMLEREAVDARVRERTAQFLNYVRRYLAPTLWFWPRDVKAYRQLVEDRINRLGKIIDAVESEQALSAHRFFEFESRRARSMRAERLFLDLSKLLFSFSLIAVGYEMVTAGPIIWLASGILALGIGIKMVVPAFLRYFRDLRKGNL